MRIEELVAEHLEGRRDNRRAPAGFFNYMAWLDLYIP
jgi:hypothetical protein